MDERKPVPKSASKPSKTRASSRLTPASSTSSLSSLAPTEFVGPVAPLTQSSSSSAASVVTVSRPQTPPPQEPIRRVPLVQFPVVVIDPIMVYSPYSAAVKLLQRHAWCTLTDLSDFVRAFQFVGFHVHANRRRVADAYQMLRAHAPFKVDVRFPDEFYVHLDGPVTVWFEQLLTSLDLPDRQMEREGSHFNNNDAKRAFDVAFSRLAAVVRSVDVETLAKEHIYDRETFEATYHLQWA